INRGWAPLYGLVRGSLKYVDLPIPELYDLSSDPSESHDLSASRPADLRELQRLLAQLRADDRRAGPVRESVGTREQLRSLGYVTGSAPAKERYTEADDPKRLIHIDRAIDGIVSQYQPGDLPGAIAAAARVGRAEARGAGGVRSRTGRRPGQWPAARRHRDGVSDGRRTRSGGGCFQRGACHRSGPGARAQWPRRHRGRTPQLSAGARPLAARRRTRSA